MNDITILTGSYLDNVGQSLGLVRMDKETDIRFRSRMSRFIQNVTHMQFRKRKYLICA